MSIFCYLSGQLSPRHWLMLMVVCTAILQSIFSIGIWHVEGSLAELIDSTDESSTREGHVVCKRCKVDLEHFKEEVSDVVGSYESKRNGELLANQQGDDYNDDDIDRYHHEKLGFFGRIKSAAKYVVEPFSSYVSLMKRFESWRKDYVKLQEEYGTRADGKPRLANPMDLIRSEYAIVDQIVLAEACQLDKEKSVKDFENMDLIFKILEILIDRLESDLIQLMEEGPPSDELVAEWEAKRRQAESEGANKESIGRARRIITKSIANKVQKESNRLAAIYVINAATQYATRSFGEEGADGVSGLLATLEPALIKTGFIDTTLLVSYLYDIRFRVIKNVTRQLITSLARFCVGKNKRLEEVGE